MDWNTLLLPSATAFGLALLHSAWIGALIYGLVRTALPLLRRPAARHHLAYAGLLALGVGFVVAFYRNYDAAPVCENVLFASTSLSDFSALFATLPTEQTWLERLQAALPNLAPWLSLGYVVGLLPAVLFLLRDHRRATRLKTIGLSEIPLTWADGIAAELLSHPTTRRVRCYLSDRAEEVMTLGFWSPVIVFPLALVNRLSPEMARTILLHEIAHLRAYDHLLNYPQQILRTFFFYHPAAHALCRLIDREREHRCDDWVADHCGDRRTYASALVTVARTSLYPQTNLAMSASKTPFSTRIHRLFHGEAEHRGQFSFSVLFLALLTAGHLSFTTLGADAGAVDCLEEQGKDILAETPDLNPVVVDDEGLEVNMSLETVLEIAEDEATIYKAVYVEPAPAVTKTRSSDANERGATENEGGQTATSATLGNQGPSSLAKKSAPARLPLGYISPLEKNSCQTIKRIPKPCSLPTVAIQQDTTPPKAVEQTTTIRIRGAGTSNKTPIYIVDGKVITEGVINDLDADNIESVKVIKGESALVLYGPEGQQRGVVVITTKDGTPLPPPASYRINGSKLAPGDLTDQYNQYLLGDLKNVGYLLNGKQVRYGKIKKLKTDQIISINVYNGKEEIARLGFPTMDGVISIKTKE